MKEKSLQDELRESLWRRKLTGAGRKELRAQPGLELEARLTETLRALPPVPVASNFTARVLQAVEREDARRPRAWNFRWNWHRLLPRVAVAAVAVLSIGLALQSYEANARRAALARSVAFVAGTQSLPSVEALKNFDVIQRMGQPQHADEELLALLQ